MGLAQTIANTAKVNRKRDSDGVAQNGEPQPSPEDAPTVNITVDSETIRETGNSLFMLWLKIGLTLIAVRLAVRGWPVVVLLIVSIMFVATFNPVVTRLQRRLTRGKAITLVVGGLIVTLCGLLLAIIPPLLRQGRNLLIHLPGYLTEMERGAQKMGVHLNLHGSSLDLTHYASNLGPSLLDVMMTIFSGVTGVLTVAVLTTYLLIDGQRVATGVIGLLPRQHRLLVRQMFGEIGDQVGDYMRGQLVTSLLAGLFSYILLLAMHVPEPLALAFIMAVSDAIPLAGPLIGTVPAVFMALTRGTSTAAIVLIAYVVYHQIESPILVPRIYGQSLKLSPSIVVIVILIGATLLGVLGALIALPIAAAIPVVLRYFQEWRAREDESDEAEPKPALP